MALHRNSRLIEIWPAGKSTLFSLVFLFSLSLCSLCSRCPAASASAGNTSVAQLSGPPFGQGKPYGDGDMRSVCSTPARAGRNLSYAERTAPYFTGWPSRSRQSRCQHSGIFAGLQAAVLCATARSPTNEVAVEDLGGCSPRAEHTSAVRPAPSSLLSSSGREPSSCDCAIPDGPVAVPVAD